MVAPVTGPFTISEYVPYPSGSISYKIRTWSRQKRPYNLPLNFNYVKAKVTATFNRDPSTITDINVSPDPSLRNAAITEARKKLVTKIAETRSQLLTLGAERQSAINMIAKRAGQLANFVVALKSRDLPAAARAIGQRKALHRKNGSLITRSDLRDVSGVVLETMFGWVPLAGDIYNACKVLSSGVPPVRVTARYRIDSPGDWYPYTYAHMYATQQVIARVGCNVRIDNPNLHLADQLGLINLAHAAYELTPWSFVANYFFTIDEFMASFTEFMGLSITESYTSSLGLCNQRLEYFNPTIGHYWSSQGYHVRAIRVPGLPSGPTLKLRDPWILKTQRATTSVALLGQQVRSLPHPQTARKGRIPVPFDSVSKIF